MGYERVRQRGSHVRVTTQQGGEHHEVMPPHDPICAKTLSSILESVAGERVRYRVEVEGGSMITEGTIDLERLADGTEGTRVTWRETGDFGWNPILGYVARAMDRLQGREMEVGLERLRDASSP